MTSTPSTRPEAATLTAVVVSRGLDTLLRFCLEALERALACCSELRGSTVVVVDNGSPSPYRRRMLPDAALIRFDRGQSFARANNAAVRAHPATYYLLVNNDVLLDRRAIAEMLRAMADVRNAGICGTRLTFPGGTIQHCGVVFGCDGGPYHDNRGQPAETVPRQNRELQAVTGACMLIRHDVWAQLDGFEPSYPFGLEDIDFCLRARQRGWRVVCCNQTDSLHLESMTPGRIELDVASRALFNQRWRGRYTIDG
jgi:GT2 family glycosyltransferase